MLIGGGGSGDGWPPVVHGAVFVPLKSEPIVYEEQPEPDGPIFITLPAKTNLANIATAMSCKKIKTKTKFT